MRRTLRVVVVLSVAFVLSMICLVIAIQSNLGKPTFRAEFIEQFSTLTLLITGVELTSVLVLFAKKDGVLSIARARHGALCTKCEYLLPDDESGTCPECGTRYTRQSNAVFWGAPYERHVGDGGGGSERQPDQGDNPH